MVGYNGFNYKPPDVDISTLSWQGGAPSEGSKKAVSILIGGDYLKPAIVV